MILATRSGLTIKRIYIGVEKVLEEAIGHDMPRCQPCKLGIYRFLCICQQIFAPIELLGFASRFCILQAELLCHDIVNFRMGC